MTCVYTITGIYPDGSGKTSNIDVELEFEGREKTETTLCGFPLTTQGEFLERLKSYIADQEAPPPEPEKIPDEIAKLIGQTGKM